MNVKDQVFSSINRFHQFLVALREDLKASQTNPDQCVFDFKIECHPAVHDFSEYIFTRKKDEAKISFVIVYDSSQSAFSHITIDGNKLPSIFLNSDLIKQDLLDICHMVNTFTNEKKLKKTLDCVMYRLEEFFEESIDIYRYLI